MQGTIIRGIGGFYTVLGENGQEYTLRMQRKMKHNGMKPKVGDHAEFQPGSGEEHGWVVAIGERRNELVRPPVANIDVIVLVAACAVPEADLLLMDRMLIAAHRRGIEPMLVITKCELAPERTQEILAQYAGAGICTMAVSSATGEGIKTLRDALRGKVHALAGQSGAGKSSLINALYGTQLETGELSDKIDRGKNTTRRCELIPLEDGSMVLDTPGFSLLEADLFEPVELKDAYPEFRPYEGTCYFKPCYHATEPRCGVRDALQEGKIHCERHERYMQLLEEIKQQWRERYD